MAEISEQSAREKNIRHGHTYYDDHPPPHFHDRYGTQKALVSIESLSVLRGQIRPRVLGLVTEWATMHQSDLLENWRRARENETLNLISPLE